MRKFDNPIEGCDYMKCLDKTDVEKAKIFVYGMHSAGRAFVLADTNFYTWKLWKYEDYNGKASFKLVKIGKQSGGTDEDLRFFRRVIAQDKSNDTFTDISFEVKGEKQYNVKAIRFANEDGVVITLDNGFIVAFRAYSDDECDDDE